MGTRNLTFVKLDGKYRIAQYGQWDGQPSGQGETVLQFLKDILNEEAVSTFKEKLLKCRFATKEELQEIGKDKNWASKYPQLSRDAGAGILEMVCSGEPPMVLKDETNFANDSVFCEWAYVIDFDSGTFEVFTGFNKIQLTPQDRFYTGNKPDKEYYPIRLLKSFPLDQLPPEEEFFALEESD
jgi:hypothetical protein